MINIKHQAIIVFSPNHTLMAVDSWLFFQNQPPPHNYFRNIADSTIFFNASLLTNLFQKIIFHILLLSAIKIPTWRVCYGSFKN